MLVRKGGYIRRTPHPVVLEGPNINLIIRYSDYYWVGVPVHPKDTCEFLSVILPGSRNSHLPIWTQWVGNEGVQGFGNSV